VVGRPHCCGPDTKLKHYSGKAWQKKLAHLMVSIVLFSFQMFGDFFLCYISDTDFEFSSHCSWRIHCMVSIILSLWRLYYGP
jgi:hypothetical protein